MSASAIFSYTIAWRSPMAFAGTKNYFVHEAQLLNLCDALRASSLHTDSTD